MKHAVLVVLGVLCFMVAPALAAVPEISHISPDYAGMHQRAFEYQTHYVITGEGFQTGKLEFWGWKADGDIEAAIRSKSFDDLQLPAKPPEGARKIKPLDVEEQVAVAGLSHSGAVSVVWASNGDGFSRPYPIHMAKPFWISRNEAHPGDILYMFGFGLRTPGSVISGGNCFVALRGPGGVFMARPVKEARSARSADSNLVHFELPLELPAGEFAVYAHNGQGGAYGWRKAGDLKISPRPTARKRDFRAGDFGASATGLKCEHKALQSAVDAAARAGGGRVLLQAGTYRVSETLKVPAGVEIVGAGAEQSIIEGFGYDPFNALSSWWAPTSVAASVIVLDSHTRLESLGVRGAVSRGLGGYGTINSMSSTGTVPRHITIKGCRIQSIDGDNEDGRYRYRAALVLPGEYHSVLDNDITGSLEMRPRVRRSEIINNNFRAGYALDECALMLRGSELLVDANRLQDSAGRLVLYANTHSYVRYNEILNYGGRSGWANVPEPFLLHGSGFKSMGNPTAVEAGSLTDGKQAWQTDEYAGATVLISHGRGMGQYRLVKGNSSDTLFLSEPWRVQPDGTSEYSVGSYFTENALVANQNHTPGRLSLWLDCIGNLVEKHRDVLAGGMDAWGQDRSSVNAEGKGDLLQRFHPSWYNLFLDNWLDGSAISLYPGVAANNAWRGIPLFGNAMIHNKVRQPHMQRNPNTALSTREGGLIVGGGKGRVGASHNILAGNQVSNTPAGVLIEGQADKTFVIGNLFHAVDLPMVDGGARTRAVGNQIERMTENGSEKNALPDRTGERTFGPFEPPRLAEPFAVKRSRGEAEMSWLQSKLAGRSFDAGAAESLEAQRACARNLTRLHELLKQYDKAHGSLPDALFYPLPGQDAKRSLAAMLGSAAAPLLICPATPRLENIHYVWNSSLGGIVLKTIPEPGKTWLLMDMTACHTWLLDNHFAGHRGGVNALFADGTVRLFTPAEATALLAAE